MTNNQTISPSLEELVTRWNQGDHTIFHLMHSDLSRVVEMALRIRHVRPGRMDYEDIQQECWMEIMKKLARWDPERGTVRNFLIACCSNQVLKYIYRHQKHEKFEDSRESVETSSALPLDMIQPELEITFGPRLRGFRVDYITRRVFVAMFYEVFDAERKKIFSELLDVTKLSKRKLNFLMDYASVAIRLHLIARSRWH